MNVNKQILRLFCLHARDINEFHAKLRVFLYDFLCSQFLILILVLLTLISSIYQSNLQFLFFLFTKTFNIKKKNLKLDYEKLGVYKKKLNVGTSYGIFV